MTARVTHRLLFLTYMSGFAALGSPVLTTTARAAANNLVSEAITIPKESGALAPATRAYLTRNGSTTSRIWVYFTDKGTTK